MEVFIADFFVALYIKGFCAGIRAPIPAVLRFRDIDQFPGLQSELIAIGEEFQIEEFNLLDSFSPGSLGYLSLRSQKIERPVPRRNISGFPLKARQEKFPMLCGTSSCCQAFL